jgi:hypothetical protein
MRWIFSFKINLESQNPWKVKNKSSHVHAMSEYRRSRGVAPLILNLGTTWRWVKHHAPAALPRWKARRCRPNSRLGESQSRRFGDRKKNLLPLLGLERHIVQPVAWSLDRLSYYSSRQGGGGGGGKQNTSSLPWNWKWSTLIQSQLFTLTMITSDTFIKITPTKLQAIQAVRWCLYFSAWLNIWVCMLGQYIALTSTEQLCIHDRQFIELLT